MERLWQIRAGLKNRQDIRPVYARTVQAVLGVSLMEFGIPEVMWHLRVKGFAAIVTMDAHGGSLHAYTVHAMGEVLETLQKA